MNKAAPKLDPITGPLTREELTALVAAPYGRATEAIRQFDPFWGRAPGEKIEWKVRCEGDMHGIAIVKAASEEEAKKLADDLTYGDVDWGDDGDDFIIVSVEPVKPRKPR